MPPGAATEVEPGAVARQRIGRGEVVMAHDVRRDRRAAGADPRRLARGRDRRTGAQRARVGDDVAIASGGVTLADEAVVVGVDAESVLVAVPTDAAAQVAQAASTGDVALLDQVGLITAG